MKHVLRFFFTAGGTSPWMVLGCLVLASLSEGIGVASLLPLLSMATDVPIAGSSKVNAWIAGAFAMVGAKPTFTALIIIVVVGSLLKVGLTLMAMRYIAYAQAEVTTRLRLDILHNTLRVRWPFFITQPLGRITTAIGGEAMRAAAGYRAAADLLADGIYVVIYLVIAIILSWKLALAGLVFGGLLAALLGVFVRMARRASEKHTIHSREMMIYLNDVLNNIKPIKAMHKEAPFELYLQGKLRRLRNVFRREFTSGVFLEQSQEGLIAIAMGVGLWVAVVVWSTPLAELIVMYLVIMRVIKSLARLQRRYQAAALVEHPYLEVRKLLAETRREEEQLHGGREPRLDHMCRVQDVTFSYGDKPVLANVNLEIHAGEITVLMGVSGAGKSTLTDLLLGLYEPDSGAILLDGIPLAGVNLGAWRRMIGYVPQDLQLFHDTILANITLGDAGVSEADAREALIAAGAWEFVAALPEQMRSHVGEKGARLSGGQRQRIALARALAVRPKLLILDEVTSALDVETERGICRTLRSMPHRPAILAITHRPQLIEVADRAYRIEAGTAREIEMALQAVG